MRNAHCLSHPIYSSPDWLIHRRNVFPLVSNVNILFKPWTGKLTRYNTTICSKLPSPPSKDLTSGYLGCVLRGLSPPQAHSPWAFLGPLASGRYAGKEKTVLPHSPHINHRAWDYKEEQNTLIDERIGVNVKPGILLNAVQFQVLLNFSLQTKSGCLKFSRRGNSSFPAFLAHGVTLLSQWCGEKMMGLGIHGTQICVLLSCIYLWAGVPSTAKGEKWHSPGRQECCVY